LRQPLTSILSPLRKGRGELEAKQRFEAFGLTARRANR
jgi:hypothetical protein